MERDAFKKRVPPRLRGPVANRFLDKIRSKLHDSGFGSDDVVHAVFAEATHDRNRYRDRVATPLHNLIRDHFDEAVTYADFLTEYERKPKEVRRWKKRCRESMRQANPTAKQQQFLGELGVAAIPATRLDAHDMIDASIKTSIRWTGRGSRSLGAKFSDVFDNDE